jgi:phage baseplate assembly protein gpV
MQLSKLHCYSVGYAVENKALSSWDLEVYPVEVLGYTDGEISADRGEDTVEGVDVFGQKYTIRVEMSHSIKARWLSFESNRKTPPDVRRGEKVYIYRFADVDKYYWMSDKESEHLRRLETVIYAISATRDESTKALTPENTYYLELSSHTKQITLHTSKADGEPFAYTFQFNLKDGAVTLEDDDGNSFLLDSVERQLMLKNKDGSLLDVNKRNILIEAPDSVTIKTKAYNVIADTVNRVVKSSITDATPLYNGNITQANFSGKVSIKGLTTLMGGISTVGSVSGVAASITVPITMTSTTTMSGGAEVSGTFIVNGVNCGSTHKHTCAAPGSDSSVPH